MLAFFRIVLAEHLRVCTSTHACTRPVTRPPFARFRAIVTPRYYSIVVAPVLLLCYLRSRVDMVLITLHFDCFFFLLDMCCTRRLSIGDETFRRFRNRMLVVRAHAHARTRWIFTRYRHFFFTHLSGRDFVGPPHILDSAVLISELWAHRGNSHSKNGFFRPSGAVMER